MTKRILSKIQINEISAVDKPAQEGATAVLLSARMTTSRSGTT